MTPRQPEYLTMTLRTLLKQEKFTFDTRKEAKAEATRIGLFADEYEIARDDSGYFIVWLIKKD